MLTSDPDSEFEPHISCQDHLPRFCATRYVRVASPNSFPKETDSLIDCSSTIGDSVLHKMSSTSTPNSRRRGHSSRKSQSSTPAQSQANGTPRAGASRLQDNGNAVPSSSPIFFASSPANGSQSRLNRPGGSSRGNNDLVISSPPRQQSSNAGDQENTPRATRPAIGGELRLYKS
jgi:hypothetical protein